MTSLGVFGCLILPPVLCFIATIWFPFVGLWDAVTEGLLVGVGFALFAHPTLLDVRKLGLSLGTTIIGLGLLEVGVRVYMPPPPSYPIGEGPHFLLSNMVMFAGPDSDLFLNGKIPPLLEKITMSADPNSMSHYKQPPSKLVTKELVCSIVYGEGYQGAIDVSLRRDIVWPRESIVRDDVEHRVLHVGDSMVFGHEVPREMNFSSVLGVLEPNIQHINAAISGTAPDDYLVILNSWIERASFDLAVIYLFSGNDVRAIGAPHPCSNWESILSYENGKARLRYPDNPKSDNRTGFKWLAINSPLPYLLRVMIAKGSSVAAYLGALQPLDGLEYEEEREQKKERLEVILRTARDNLAEREIPLVVVMLPSHDAFTGQLNGPSEQLAMQIIPFTSRNQIPSLDATQLLRESLGRGESPIQLDRTHFTEQGHKLVAEWLHEELYEVVTLKPAGSEANGGGEVP
jgi:lysophospholipase L1-like esterase